MKVQVPGLELDRIGYKKEEKKGMRGIRVGEGRDKMRDEGDGQG